MKKKRTSPFGSFSLQLVLCSAAVCSMITGTLLAFFHPEAPAKASHPAAAGLTFAERVAYQRAIEEVYWHHRIWPKSNASAKPPLDKVMSQVEIEKKVEDYLRDSKALEDYWQRPITPDQLQAEMERIASHTKQPGVLREIFAALGNDSLVIAECLARPVLTERLIKELYAHDQRFHGELKGRAEAELRTHTTVTQMKQTSGLYSEVEWIKSDSANDGSAPADAKSAQALKMNGSEWQDSVEKLAAQFDSQDIVGQAPRLPNGGLAAGAAALQAPDAPRREETHTWSQIKIGVLSSLQEDNEHYYAVAVMKKGKDRLKLATIAWLKEPLRSWVAKAEAQAPVTMAAVNASYTLPVLASPSGGCTDDTWMATSRGTSIPAGREEHTAVWTGSEMIVWGGYSGSSYLNTGGRYDPSTDSWTATSLTNAPDGRVDHTAVWTGTEMIVWGGWNFPNSLNTGGKYNPSTDSWTATSLTNAPEGRYYHTAVWTGSEMIVWGGFFGVLNTGGRYNPGTNGWTATSLTNAPVDRWRHTAVWTGSQMIVWGGYNDSGAVNTGGRYNPNNDSWAATTLTNAPDARGSHTAIWTGIEMIVWGGIGFFSNDVSTGERCCAQFAPSTPTPTRLTTATAGPTPSPTPSMSGGRYNPITDSWTATSTTNAPDGRAGHTAVWTGSEMIIWGGTNNNGSLNTGGSYSPSSNSWRATNTTNAPAARGFHTAVWTGSEMIVWGGLPGYLSTGGRYDPSIDTWTATNIPAPSAGHTAVWTGSEMIVWGGGNANGFLNTGARYNPSTDDWTVTSTINAPIARSLHTAVWAGSEMIVWGGQGNGGYFNTGGRYNPATDDWVAISNANAPTARSGHTAVWTGSEMIVWGGSGNGPSYLSADGGSFAQFIPGGTPTPTPTAPPAIGTGGRYNPTTNSWTATNTTNAPTARLSHTAVWTGSEMIVWGGTSFSNYFNTGGRYNPNMNSWMAVSTSNAPAARFHHTAVWTGSEMIIWGGYNGGYFNTGARYNRNTDSWTAISTTSAPEARESHTAVWTGSEMIVWGGTGGSSYLNTGGRYNSGTDSWRATSATNAPAARQSHTAVWTGSEMIVWGGYDASSDLNTGGRYCARPGFTPTPTPTATPTPSEPSVTPSPTPTTTGTPTPAPRVTPTQRPHPTPPPRP